ncbi:hypothetical protein [Streptomyces sp. NPDC006610]|jgi:hypothetical protein|uniref:hypothetical protein n=1 Tax=Streptomyces sp. NPDC006610 TaxID=3154584 RepID=UPI0033B0A196
MTQPIPPQPTDGNPFAQQQAQPADGNPFGQLPPAPPARGNVALGVVTAVVVALVTAGIYGAIVGATEYEIGYAAVGVGFLVGFGAGKVGGANPVLPVVSALLSLGAVYLGQLIGISMIAGDLAGVSATTMFTEHFDILTEAWKESADAMSFLFFAIGAVAAFSGAKKAAA